MISKLAVLRFRSTVWTYYRKCGRDLPWRHTADTYAIVVSEIMLQQTQVDRVRGKYREFLKKFPTCASLARASSPQVLRVWQGLGYNRRAIALHNLAKIVKEKFGGKIPEKREELEKLPGIGKATAGSIRAFAFNAPEIFIETNIRRAVIHHFFPRHQKVNEERVCEAVRVTLDKKKPREWYWALMDYGAMLGKTVVNPNRRSAHYRKQSPFRGSDRELRGKILRVLLKKSQVAVAAFLSITEKPEEKVHRILTALEKEGFLRQKRGIVMIAK